jgi:uncharacterized protein YndB with AHSA1/START domain
MSSDVVRVSTQVATDPESAFDLFTSEVDAWWRRGPRFRHGGTRPSVMRFEGGEGGRLVEVYTDEGGGVFEVGRVQVWKPGDRLVFEWRGNNFAPGLLTEVEVRFERVERGTRITLEHRGWDRVPLEHPARHGYGASPAFVSMIGLYWGDQLASLRVYTGKGDPR